jgi:hypothetical protein
MGAKLGPGWRQSHNYRKELRIIFEPKRDDITWIWETYIIRTLHLSFYCGYAEEKYMSRIVCGTRGEYKMRNPQNKDIIWEHTCTLVPIIIIL